MELKKRRMGKAKKRTSDQFANILQQIGVAIANGKTQPVLLTTEEYWGSPMQNCRRTSSNVARATLLRQSSQ